MEKIASEVKRIGSKRLRDFMSKDSEGMSRKSRDALSGVRLESYADGEMLELIMSLPDFLRRDFPERWIKSLYQNEFWSAR